LAKRRKRAFQRLNYPAFGAGGVFEDWVSPHIYSPVKQEVMMA